MEALRKPRNDPPYPLPVSVSFRNLEALQVLQSRIRMKPNLGVIIYSQDDCSGIWVLEETKIL